LPAQKRKEVKDIKRLPRETKKKKEAGISNACLRKIKEQERGEQSGRDSIQKHI
jgi:hypothetical protein